MDGMKLISEFTSYLRRKGKTKSTIIAYQNDIKQLMNINGNRDLSSLDESNIKESLKKLQVANSLTPKTLSRKLNSIRTFYKYLEKQKVISNNPAIKINHPKFRNKKPRILTRLEYLELKEICRDNIRLYTMIELLLQTGIRIGELSRLKVKDITLNSTKPSLQIVKFGSINGRVIPLNLKANKTLKIYLDEAKIKDKLNSPLFITKSGKGIEVRNIRSSIDRAIIKAKVKDACVNDIRNTFIVHQLNMGMSLSDVAGLVGHKNTVTTSRYLELLPKKHKVYGDTAVREL